MTVFFAWILADFLSGIAHWAQDKMLMPSQSKFKNSVIADNELHHGKPTAMLGFSIFENIRLSVTFMWPLVIVLYFIGAPTLLWLAIFFVSFGNAVHWFSHQRKVNPVIGLLQKIGMFASFDHHIVHHTNKGRLIARSNAKVRYCVMTNWVNPVLDAIGFFPFFGKVIQALQVG